MYCDYQRPFESRFASEQLKALVSEIRRKNAQAKKKRSKIIGKINATSVYKNGSNAETTGRCDQFT